MGTLWSSYSLIPKVPSRDGPCGLPQIGAASNTSYMYALDPAWMFCMDANFLFWGPWGPLWSIQEHKIWGPSKLHRISLLDSTPEWTRLFDLLHTQPIWGGEGGCLWWSNGRQILQREGPHPDFPNLSGFTPSKAPQQDYCLHLISPPCVSIYIYINGQH